MLNDRLIQMSKTLRFSFSAEVGDIIDIKALLKDNEAIETDHKTSVLQNIQSRMGKVVAGYDEGDDFIDDTDIVDRTLQPQDLNQEKFKVVISYPSNRNETKNVQQKEEHPGKEEPIIETKEIDSNLQTCLDNLKTKTSIIIMTELNKLAPGQKPKENIKFPQDVIDAVVECIDTNERIEVAKLPQPVSKKRMEQIKRDIIDLIYNECFTAANYHFTTKLKLQRIYKSQKKALEPKTDVEEPLKEEPTDAPEEVIDVMSKSGVILNPMQQIEAQIQSNQILPQQSNQVAQNDPNNQMIPQN